MKARFLAPLSLSVLAWMVLNCSPAEKKTVQAPIQLFGDLEGRRNELAASFNSATNLLLKFSEAHGWERFVEEGLVDSVLIFASKREFDVALLKRSDTDTTMQLPETYCAAVVKHKLLAVSPEIYSKAYAAGRGELAYERLLAHELAHELHIKILRGNEDAMGPLWFFEGFAMYAAGQFANRPPTLSKEEMAHIMNDPDRGSYESYNEVFRYFVERVPLPDLITRASDSTFTQELIKNIE